MKLRIGDKALVKEGLHRFTVGSVVEFVEMDAEEDVHVPTYIFKDERGVKQRLTKEEFEYIGRR